MIGINSNLLVYAHREDSPWYDAADARIAELAEGKTPWAIPWPCIHECLAIVTDPNTYAPPTPLAAAIDQIEPRSFQCPVCPSWRVGKGLNRLPQEESSRAPRGTRGRRRLTLRLVLRRQALNLLQVVQVVAGEGFQLLAQAEEAPLGVEAGPPEILLGGPPKQPEL